MPEEFVGNESDFADRERKIICKGNLEIGVFCVNGSFYA